MTTSLIIDIVITALLVLLTTVVLNQVFHTEGGKAE